MEGLLTSVRDSYRWEKAIPLQLNGILVVFRYLYYSSYDCPLTFIYLY